MAKLKLGAIADEKPMKLTANSLRPYIAICSLTLMHLHAKPGSRSPTPQNWSRRCWHGSWRRTAHLQKARRKNQVEGEG
jgi:hypothetical protein